MNSAINWKNAHIQQLLVGVPQLIVRLFYFLSGGSCVFIFFACPKKTEPKERAPYDWVATRLPCASRLYWRENKLARCAPSNKFSLPPIKAAMLGCIEGTNIKTPDLKLVH